MPPYSSSETFYYATSYMCGFFASGLDVAAAALVILAICSTQSSEEYKKRMEILGAMFCLSAAIFWASSQILNLRFDKLAGDRQAKEISLSNDRAQRALDKSMELKTKLARAEIQLLETQRRELPRFLLFNPLKFEKYLESHDLGPPDKNFFIVLYKAEDAEAKWLAEEIGSDIEANIDKRDPRPLPRLAHVTEPLPLSMETIKRVWGDPPEKLLFDWTAPTHSADSFIGLLPGVVCVISNNRAGKNSPEKIISDGLIDTGISSVVTGNPNLPANQIVIYVGQNFFLSPAEPRRKAK